MRVLTARAHQTARISFLDTLSLFKDSQCAKKRRLVLNIKLTEFAFLFIPPRNWSAVTRRFWLIRSLRAGSQSATTNTSARSGSESDAEPTRLPVRLFHARFQLRLSINKARDNPSSFVISMRADQDPCASRAPFYAGFLICKKCPSKPLALALLICPVVPQWLAKDDPG